MTRPTRPRLTDRALLDAHRRRAARTPGRDAFLFEAVADEVEERLAEVNRTFTDSAVVTGHPELWAQRFPGARHVPDAETLDLPEGSCDLVLHLMCLHWAEDPVGQLIQSRRALRPDGLLLVACFGGDTLQELRAALAQAEIALRGGISPRIAPMGELRDYGALLQRSGLALPVADLSRRVVNYSRLERLISDLRAMGETNALAARDPKPIPRRMFEETARAYLETASTPSGQFQATFDIVFLTGWAPAETQPKPLRPGSARTRLSDALGTVEFDPQGKPVNDADRS